MNPLPVNELLRIVQAIQAERRREVATDRHFQRRPADLDSHAMRTRIPSRGTREPRVTAHRRPMPGPAGAATVAGTHLPTF